MKVAIYVRVSAASHTTANQLDELGCIAARRDWTITKVYEAPSISGAEGRDQRPALYSLIKDATQGKFDVVAIWAMVRLGRSLQHPVEIVNELHAVGVALYVHQQVIDTSTPAGKLAFSVFGALAEYERELIRERVKAGIERAKRNGTKLGRPSNLNDSVRAAIVALRAKDHSIRQIASQLKVGCGTVYRVRLAA